MSSTILYKFRSGTTFEALSLPGNNVRLLDVKKAIVTSKKLDQGSMDFDLSVKDATSGVEYLDDAAILPRGTRIVVQRLPSARGQGILSKIARGQYGDTSFGAPTGADPSGPGADFYTIESRDRDEDEEFVSSSSAAVSHSLPSTEESELAALRAATDNTMSTGPKLGLSLRGGPGAGGVFRPNQPAGLGPPPSRGLANFQPSRTNVRPNADPELRELELQPQKKRATGIPRTFLSISAPAAADGTEGGTIGVPLIQPNTIGFEELLSRGGGQSENAAGTKRDLDYAIKLTATTIPEYLQCAICHSVVRDAMMLPWDPEGRTTCEQCIRTALSENGYRCPLTHQEGVSPDDLLPNHALRKAAVQFVNDVMEKIKEIEEQAEIEEEINVEGEQPKLIEGDLNDKGVVLTRRAIASEKRKKEDDDFFGGGDDDFGGDVFAVEAEQPAGGDLDETMAIENEIITTKSTDKMDEESAPSTVKTVEKQPEASSNSLKVETKPEKPELAASPSDQFAKTEKVPTPQDQKDNAAPRRDANRRRGPPFDLRALKNEDPKEVAERHYILCAVMRHKGTSAYSGHYVAEAMDWLSGQWYEFNDQNVEHLTDGPSCSFHPDLIDLANCPTLKSDTDRPFNVSPNGSQDAYNMYYVEHSFLAKCINESLKRERFEGDLPFQPGDIVSNVIVERSQYYENLRKLCTDDGIATSRLNKRREAISGTMFPSLAAFQLTNPADLIWVDTLFLQQFVACSDHRLYFDESQNCSILQHRKYLCAHKNPGLHPRIARRGKLLTRQSYDAYIVALNEERLAVNGDNSQCNDLPVNDCVIAPIENLVCPECTLEYRSELSNKLQLAEGILSIYHDLDQKERKFSVILDPDESLGYDQDGYAYIVSRKFATWFRNKVERFMKHNASLVSGESASGGLDLVDFSEFENTLELAAGSSEDENIAIRVNGAVTCHHGNMSTNSLNNFIYVPWSTWSLIKGVFPNSIEHKRKRIDADECNSNVENPICCEQCLEEGLAKTNARSNLSDLVKFCREAVSLKGLSNVELVEMSKSLTCTRLYLVPKKGISSWQKFLSTVSRKDGEKRHLPLPSGNPKWIHVPQKDDSDLSDVDRSRLDFLSAMFCPITCSEHGLAMRPSLFRNVDIHLPHHPFQLDDNICLLEESSYLAYISYMGAAAVMLYPLDYDPNFQGATIQDFILDGADFFDRVLGQSSFHPSCIPVSRINRKVDTDRFVVENDQMAVLFQLEEASCIIDACQQNHNAWNKNASDSDDASSAKNQQIRKGVANNPIDIDNEVVSVLVSPSYVDVKVLDVESDGDPDYVLTFLISNAGTPRINELEDSQSLLRRSSRKRISRYPVGCILDEETMEMKLDSNIAAVRLLLLERCTKGTLFSLDHSLKLIIENPNAGKNSVLAVSSEVNGKRKDSGRMVDYPPVIKAFDLTFDVNSKTLREICEEGIGIPFDNTMSISIVRQANVEKSANSIPIDDLMGHLLSLATSTVEGDHSNASKRSKRTRTEKGFRGTFLSSSDPVNDVDAMDDNDEVVVADSVEFATNKGETLDSVPVKPSAVSRSPDVPESKPSSVLDDMKNSPFSRNKNGDSLVEKESAADRIAKEKLKKRLGVPLPNYSEDPYRDCFEDDDSDDDIELLRHSPFSKQNRSGGPVVPCQPNAFLGHDIFQRSNGTEFSATTDAERNRALVADILALLRSNPDVRQNLEMCRMAAEHVVEESTSTRKTAKDLVDAVFAKFLDLTLP